MDFFDKLGKKATETYKMTAEKTGKFAKETKLKLKINDLKSEVSDVYEDIGKKVYERHEIGKKSVSFDKDLVEEISKLEDLTNQIAELNKECLTLKNKKRCPNCDKEIKMDDKFCNNCGYKLEEKEVVEAEVVEEGKRGENEKVDRKKQENKKETDKKPEHKKNENNNKKVEHKKENKNEKAKNELEKTVEVESSVKKDKKEDK